MFLYRIFCTKFSTVLSYSKFSWIGYDNCPVIMQSVLQQGAFQENQIEWEFFKKREKFCKIEHLRTIKRERERENFWLKNKAFENLSEKERELFSMWAFKSTLQKGHSRTLKRDRRFFKKRAFENFWVRQKERDFSKREHFLTFERERELF